MTPILAIDWQGVWTPSNPILETMLRGTVVYLFLFLLMRFLLKREAGELGIADLLVVVLIADASQNAMAAEYKSITDGIILVLTIVGWNYLFDWLAFRYPWFDRFVHSRPVVLIRNGRLMRRNLKKELITEEEIMSQLRQQGVVDLAKVKEACMEGDGHISVITKDAGNGKRRRPKKTIV